MRSKNRIMKLKKLDLRRLDGGCLVNSMRPMSGLQFRKGKRMLGKQKIRQLGIRSLSEARQRLPDLSQPSSLPGAPPLPALTALVALNAAAAAAGNSRGILSSTPAVGDAAAG